MFTGRRGTSRSHCCIQTSFWSRLNRFTLLLPGVGDKVCNTLVGWVAKEGWAACHRQLRIASRLLLSLQRREVLVVVGARVEGRRAVVTGRVDIRGSIRALP